MAPATSSCTSRRASSTWRARRRSPTPAPVTQTSDFDRSARQQRVITSVREQLDLSSLLAPGVIQDLLKTFRPSIKTDIPPDKIPKLIQLAQEIDLDKRISLVLDPPDYSTDVLPCPPRRPVRAQANVAKMRKDVANIFKKDRADVERATEIKSEGAVVHVLNGTASTNAKTTRIADRARLHGRERDRAADQRRARGPPGLRTQTVITRLQRASQDAMPATIALLEKTFGVTAITADDPAQEADIVIVVGSDTPRSNPDATAAGAQTARSSTGPSSWRRVAGRPRVSRPASASWL